MSWTLIVYVAVAALILISFARMWHEDGEAPRAQNIAAISGLAILWPLAPPVFFVVGIYLLCSDDGSDR